MNECTVSTGESKETESLQMNDKTNIKKTQMKKSAVGLL